ncbi:acyl-CoA dehydrogenase family protein [Streptomyces sp. NPDC046727]|uniref:acyl-CoA dehydrogenase family protein n=1 Tax=Streptomyces sp. NPDC046727 TaxID=3155373 RepID=UPI0033E625C1
MTGVIDRNRPPADSFTSLLEVAREASSSHAAKADETGQLAPEVTEAILRAGFARFFVPPAWGGGSGSFLDMTRGATAIGRGCTSAAWFASLAATLGRFAAYLPDEGRAAVWADGPDTLVVGSLVPSGTAVREGTGWRLNGSWPNVSSVRFAQWALVLALAETERGEERVFFAVPRAGYEISETWSALGMRATGSHTVLVRDWLVPDGHSFARSDLDTGRRDGADVPYCAVPLEAVSGLSFAAPVLGAARGALETWKQLYTGPRRPPAMALSAGAAEQAFARAAAEVDTAELVLESVAVAADTGTFPEGWPERGARDCALATELCVAAVDRLARSAGTGALANGRDLQRIWRDVSTAASHIMLNFPRAAAGYVRTVLT